MGVIITVDRDWRDVGRPQVAMHSQLPHFLVVLSSVENAFFIVLFNSIVTIAVSYLCIDLLSVEDSRMWHNKFD